MRSSFASFAKASGEEVESLPLNTETPAAGTAVPVALWCLNQFTSTTGSVAADGDAQIDAYIVGGIRRARKRRFSNAAVSER